jgi:hypothetical protein
MSSLDPISHMLQSQRNIPGNLLRSDFIRKCLVYTLLEGSNNLLKDFLQLMSS